MTEILVMGFGLSVVSRRKFNFLKKKLHILWFVCVLEMKAWHMRKRKMREVIL